ncbi:MAG: hypothetical protein JWO78_1214 [Micavibrio sp.]|nr:hypothetical protein [Micavibrio sp.]
MKTYRKNLPLLHRSFDAQSVLMSELEKRIAATGFIN